MEAKSEIGEIGIGDEIDNFVCQDGLRCLLPLYNEWGDPEEKEEAESSGHEQTIVSLSRNEKLSTRRYCGRGRSPKVSPPSLQSSM